jgi:DNA-binding CsgD family transcriptional regulator
VAASAASTALLAQSRGRGQLLSQRGEALFEFDRRGQLVGTNDLGDALLSSPFALRRRRLCAPFESEQSRLDRALAVALDEVPRAGLAVLGQPGTRQRLVVRTLPAVGTARDIFSLVAAFAVVSTWGEPDGPPEPLVEALRAGFDLSLTEARVTALIGLGVAPRDAARMLGVGLGTVRNHLKMAFAKTGAARQAELAALVAMIRG